MTDDALRATLDAATAALGATPAERRAVRAYQGLRGDGSRINALLSGVGVPSGEGHVSASAIRALDELVARALLPVDVVLFRGVADPTELPSLDALPMVWSRSYFLSTRVSRAVAVEAADGGAVLRLLARTRNRGLWLPPLGYRRLAYEDEVLLPRGSLVELLAWGRAADGTIEIYSEVM